MIVCSALQHKGRFLIWTYELWSIGGGAGCQWFLFGKDVYPGKYFLGWRFIRSKK